MPGITGIITKRPREWAESRLRRMVRALCHEPFYNTGVYVNEEIGLYVGWAVHRNSMSDANPILNEERDVVLVFSSEEFPAPSIVSGLKERGHRFDAGGLAHLVHLYEEDKSFPAPLNGTFHGLLVDTKLGTATLFNDRYGMHRVCYHEGKDAFYFAAESKAILEVCPELRTPNLNALGEFAAYSSILNDQTIFKDVHVLPCGSSWVFRAGSLVRKGAYFRAEEWENQEPLDEESYYQEIRDQFTRNLPRYFGGTEPIGMTLTGGLDTRLIMSWHNAAPNSLPCYTFAGPFRDPHDVKIAKQVAKVCQQTHQIIRVDDGFLSRFPSYAERSVYLSEGRLDVYRSTDLYVSERVREIAPVKIVGTYGSEIIRQAVMFKPRPRVPGLFRPEFLPYLDEAERTYLNVRQGHPVSFAVFRQSPWYIAAVFALEQTQLTVRSPYLDNDFVRTVFRGPRLGGPGTDIRARMIREGNENLARIPTDRGIGRTSGRLSATASRAIREFTFKAEYAYDYGMPQGVARIDHLLAPLHLERLFLGRHKLTHFRVWYRDALASYVKDVLLDPRALSRPYVERQRLESIVRAHTGGEQNYTTEIHTLLTLELLQRAFFDRSPGGLNESPSIG